MTVKYNAIKSLHINQCKDTSMFLDKNMWIADKKVRQCE